MRICFVCNEYPPSPHGGIGTVTQVLAREFVQQGHSVRVVGAYASDHAEPNYDEDCGVRVWRLKTPSRPVGWLQARYLLYRTVRRWALDREIDLIEVPDWAGWAAGWPRLPVPVIVRLNGSATYFAAELGKPINHTTMWLERASFRRADFCCSVSKYTANKTPALFGMTSTANAILFNPVDVPRDLLPLERSTNEIVFTGTLTPKKGILSLIRAWPRVAQARPDAELHVYGKDGFASDGTSMRSLLRRELDPMFAERVRFFGHQPREVLYRALQRARAAVFPSYAEAFALAPLEAMACQCPTIYTCRGSGPELIEHRNDGLLTDPDSPDDIASALVELLSDDDLADRLGKAGRQRVQTQFDIKVLASANESFYEQCVQSFGTSDWTPKNIAA